MAKLYKELIRKCDSFERVTELDFQGLDPSGWPGDPQGSQSRLQFACVCVCVCVCVEQGAQKQATTIAKVDERHASRPSDFTTTVARSKTAIELMNERGKSRCAEFTTRGER